jgi:hypothetical protein
VTAIADSPERADDLYAHVRAVLRKPGDKHALKKRPPIRPAFETPNSPAHIHPAPQRARGPASATARALRTFP